MKIFTKYEFLVRDQHPFDLRTTSRIRSSHVNQTTCSWSRRLHAACTRVHACWAERGSKEYWDCGHRVTTRNRISLQVPRTPSSWCNIASASNQALLLPSSIHRVQNNAKRGIDPTRRSQTLEILRWTYDPAKWKLEKDSSLKLQLLTLPGR